ncbi:MAG: hypothetical protein AAGI50_20465 [Pseudomonadota bacterium]
MATLSEKQIDIERFPQQDAGSIHSPLTQAANTGDRKTSHSNRLAYQWRFSAIGFGHVLFLPESAGYLAAFTE